MRQNKGKAWLEGGEQEEWFEEMVKMSWGEMRGRAEERNICCSIIVHWRGEQLTLAPSRSWGDLWYPVTSGWFRGLNHGRCQPGNEKQLWDFTDLWALGFFCVLCCFQSTNSVPGGPKSWAQLNGKPAGQEGGEYNKQKWSWVCACFPQTSMRWDELHFFLPSLSRLVRNGTQLS